MSLIRHVRVLLDTPCWPWSEVPCHNFCKASWSIVRRGGAGADTNTAKRSLKHIICKEHTATDTLIACKSKGNSRVIRFRFCKVIRGHLRSFGVIRVIRPCLCTCTALANPCHMCKECVWKHTLKTQSDKTTCQRYTYVCQCKTCPI